MDEKYKPIKPADVYYGFTKGEPSEAELWTGKVPNAYGNYASGNDFIDLFAGLIRRHGHMPVKSYAAKMGVEYRHLVGAITAMTGMEPRQWLCEYLNLAARELIEKTGWPLTEIAAKLNFSRITFSRFFRMMNNCQPYEWLTQNRYGKRYKYHPG